VSHAGEIHLLNIIDTKPQAAVSLYAEPYLDIKIDFVQALYTEDQPIEDPKDSIEEQGLTLNNENIRTSQSSLCRNCHRQVPLSSKVIHENMCIRMNTLCPKCNTVVKKGEMAAHDELNHIFVECVCGLLIEKYQLKEHKISYCSERKVSCPYCQYSALAKEMDEHMVHCGTRTQPCSYCNQFKKLNEMEYHLSKCKLNPNSEINIGYQFKCSKCEFNLKQILTDPRDDILPTYTTDSFISHVKSDHCNDPPCKMICPICASKYKSQGIITTPKNIDNLYQHILLHEMRILKELQWRTERLSERFT
jgi:hypothetical protein